ncbi:MAG: hypothetical protein AB7O64_10670 [Methylibium sp.]
MTGTTKPRRLRSWIPPSFAWTTIPDVFGVKVPISDPDVVEFVAAGSRLVDLHRTRAKAMVMAGLLGADGLRGQLEAAAWTVLRHTEDWKKRFAMAKVHCHGVFGLPGNRELLVLVGVNPPSRPRGWLSEAVCAAARELLAEHQAKDAEFDEHMERKKQENDELFGRSPAMEKARNVSDALLAMEEIHQRPVLTAERLLPHLPLAATFAARGSHSLRTIERAATTAIAESGWAESRDGTYVGLLSIPMGRERIGLVTWKPYAGLPAYPEVRWAIQRRLPRALLNPRLRHSGRPEFEHAAKPRDETVVVLDGSADGPDPVEALDDLQLDDTDFRTRVDEVRRDTQAHGFEAIAWFQPYHSWTEETWGIFFDARKLDDLALSFLDDFKSQRIFASPSDAARLAFGLTYAHEMFHGRVEATLSWLEISALQPRHQRYKQRVYDALREAPDWLEEALANWSAWDWFRSAPVQALFSRRMPTLDGLQRVVESSLDLSPPGYRDWRVGHQAATWRTFATQLSTGSPKPTAPAIGLPLESTIRGPLPYGIQAADIPLRFVGPGVIADRLHSHPATFNVPTRRELERALKHFKHDVDPSGGKGGHQKWTGPDRRAFILPTRDPVSVGVFKTFLQHLGIDKTTYVRDVRPNL